LNGVIQSSSQFHCCHGCARYPCNYQCLFTCGQVEESDEEEEESDGEEEEKYTLEAIVGRVE